MADKLAKLTPAELSKMPSMPPPPGTVIDFDGPNPLERTTITVTSIFMGIACVFVSIRAYTKVKVYGKGSWDDLTCALGLTCTLIYWIVVLLQCMNEGFGRHLWNVPLIITLSDDFLKLAYISDWFCNVAYTFVKLTFFILYWNIFRPFRWLKIGIVGGAIVVVTVYMAFTLASLIGATPRPGQSWLESSQSSGNGIGIKLSIPLAAWALVSDVFILVLPISGVSRLQLSPKKKFALSMVFMTGIGACVCSSLSLYYRTLLNNDVTYSVVNIQILVIIELSVGIYITCMPATSVFIRHIMPDADTIRSKMSFYSSKVRHNLPLHQSQHSQKSKIQERKVDSIDRPYLNLKDRRLAANDKEAYELGLYHNQGVKTNVSAEPFGDFSDDRIHLRVDMEQSLA